MEWNSRITNDFSKLPSGALLNLLQQEKDPFEQAYIALTNPLIKEQYEKELQKRDYWLQILEDEYILDIPYQHRADPLKPEKLCRLLSILVKPYTEKEAIIPDVKSTFDIRHNLVLFFDLVEIVSYNLTKNEGANELEESYHSSNLINFVNIFLFNFTGGYLSPKYYLLLRERLGDYANTLRRKTESIDDIIRSTYFSSFGDLITKYLNKDVSLESMENYIRDLQEVFPSVGLPTNILLRVVRLDSSSARRLVYLLVKYLQPDSLHWTLELLYGLKVYRQEYYDMYLSSGIVFDRYRQQGVRSLGKEGEAVLEKPLNTVQDLIIWGRFQSNNTKLNFTQDFISALDNFLTSGNQAQIVEFRKFLKERESFKYHEIFEASLPFREIVLDEFYKNGDLSQATIIFGEHPSEEAVVEVFSNKTNGKMKHDLLRMYDDFVEDGEFDFDIDAVRKEIEAKQREAARKRREAKERKNTEMLRERRRAARQMESSSSSTSNSSEEEKLKKKIGRKPMTRSGSKRKEVLESSSSSSEEEKPIKKGRVARKTKVQESSSESDQKT